MHLNSNSFFFSRVCWSFLMETETLNVHFMLNTLLVVLLWSSLLLNVCI